IKAGEIGLAIGRLHRNALGRQPRLGVAGGCSGRDRLEGDICEIRNAAHGVALGWPSFNCMIRASQFKSRSRSSPAPGVGFAISVRWLKRSKTRMERPKALIFRVEMYAASDRNTTEKMTTEGSISPKSISTATQTAMTQPTPSRT